MILFHLFIGWLLADFISGMVHWWEDEFIDSNTPIIGSSIGAPNELHHNDPLDFLNSNFFERNNTTWLGVIIVALAWLFTFGFSWIFVGAFIGGMLSNEIHAWSHKTERPKIIRALQECGIFQSRQMHAKHHKGNMDTNYCVMTNYLNPWLNYIGYWKFLNKLFRTKSYVRLQ